MRVEKTTENYKLSDIPWVSRRKYPDKYKNIPSGIRFKEHPFRKHGRQPDRYWGLQYRIGDKIHNVGLGWASAGVTLDECRDKLKEYKTAGRKNKGPQNKRQEIREKRNKEKAEALKAMTVSTFFKEYYQPWAEDNKSEKTGHNEGRLFKTWISPVIGNIAIKDVAPNHLDMIMQALEKKGRATRTIQYTLAVIRQIFNYARMIGYYPYPKNPSPNKKMEKLNNRRARYLTRDEAERLLDLLKKRSPQTHDLALLSLHCGLRRGEIFNLKWSHINLHNKELLIVDPKNGENRRAYMTSDVHKMLKGLPKGKAEEYVFTDSNGNRLTEVSKTFDRSVDELGLNEGITDPRLKVVFHTLRHTYASWLVSQGESLFTVMVLMGHKSLAMTTRYSHPDQNVIESAVKKFDETTCTQKHLRKGAARKLRLVSRR